MKRIVHTPLEDGVAITTIVAWTCIVASGICLACAIIFAFADYFATKPLKQVAKKIEHGGTGGTPIQEQSAAIDFDGLAKLAQAIGKLSGSSSFLVVSLAFASIAAAIVSVASFTSG